jgi:vacuolar-type H+-ATPase subunit H
VNKLSIEEIKTLVRLEKDAEKQLREAKERAESTIAEARKNASKKVSAAEDQEYYDSLLKECMKETDAKKRLMEEETEKRIIQIRKAAKGAPMKDAVSLIVKRVLGE